MLLMASLIDGTWPKETISVQQDVTVNISKTEKQRKQTNKQKNRLFKICETTTKNKRIIGRSEEERNRRECFER